MKNKIKDKINRKEINKFEKKQKEVIFNFNERQTKCATSGNIQIDEHSRGFYMVYSKLLDIQCRHWCNLLEFVKASDLGEKNVKLLKLIHKNETVVVELAHELFK